MVWRVPEGVEALAELSMLRAGGGVVVRLPEDLPDLAGSDKAASWSDVGRHRRIQVIVVHRPRYDDWSFPKGKADNGEDDAACALREVREETGLVCRLGSQLAATRYRDVDNRRKVVRYWFMYPDPGNEARVTRPKEVDEVSWLDLATALHRLTYSRDRCVLVKAARALGSRPRHQRGEQLAVP